MGDTRIIRTATGLWQALVTCLSMSGASHIVDHGGKGRGDPAVAPEQTPPPEHKPSPDGDAALS